ncbi:MAG: hypothetical protein CSA97_03450 [Bacteroidetes bacterium]|nr:MAG: hypothetical protein CSA97_03450 [Bacteroidota bacterium]
MNSRIKLCLLALIALVGSTGYAQAKSSIRLKVNGMRDSAIILGYYYGEGRYALDTAKMDARGRVTFHNDSTYKPGMYLAIVPSTGILEFMLGKGPQNVKITFDKDSFIPSEKAEGSSVLEDFVAFQQYMLSMQDKTDELRKLDSIARVKNPDKPQETEEFKKLERLNKQYNQEVEDYKLKLVKKHKDDILGKFTMAVKPVIVPEYKAPEGIKNRDSAEWRYGYDYIKAHYLDNIDLGYEGILNLPTVVDKVETYLDKKMLQLPDTLARYCDTILERSSPSRNNFSFWASRLLNKYQMSEIVGMDAVFVHIAERYFLKGRTPWVSDSIIAKIEKRVRALKPNLLGKVAPDFHVQQIDGQGYQLLKDTTPKATLLIFWEPSCSHCRVAIPKLDSICKPLEKEGLRVVAFMTQGDGPKWQEYVQEHKLNRWTNVWDPYRTSNFDKYYDIYSTPVIYILDKDHKIVVKRIGVESVDPVVRELLGLPQLEKKDGDEGGKGKKDKKKGKENSK